MNWHIGHKKWFNIAKLFLNQPFLKPKIDCPNSFTYGKKRKFGSLQYKSLDLIKISKNLQDNTAGRTLRSYNSRIYSTVLSAQL